jgi:NADH-quinone oxidoreductase subunit F
MDLRLLTERPSEAERTAVDAVVGPPDPGDGRAVEGGHAARRRRTLLLPALHALQDAVGAITRGGVAYVSERLTVPPTDVYGVASFYSLLEVEGGGGPSSHHCDDIVCGASDGATGPRDHGSPCLGQCDRRPAVLHHQPGSGYRVEAAGIMDPGPGDVHQSPEELRLLRRVGVVDPSSLDGYVSSGGFEVLASARRAGPEEVIAELRAAGLRGRGGAAFPVAVKWDGVRRAQGTTYVIANGDESEPGAFKDRMLMEGDPFAIVEALAVFGFATEADRGFIYVRGEYPIAADRLEAAVDTATSAGLIDLPIEVRRGAGAYICGEETALFASIEGLRGEPRQKPPFPNEAGVFGQPTGINNIETLVAALEALRMGGAAFAAIGTEGSTGPKLFSVSGDVERPGVYEVPFGTSGRDLLALAGGVRGGRSLGAVLLGGAAGVFAADDALEVPLTFEHTRQAGLTLGAGAVIFFDDETDFGWVVRRIARFFREESCGQCVPCRVGTVRQEEALDRLLADPARRSTEVPLLGDLALAMDDASICGLGRTASWAVQSALELGLVGR